MHRFFLAFLLVAFWLIFPLNVSANQAAPPWWASETVVAVGNGFMPKRIDDPEHGKFLAREAAIMDASRKLAEKVAGIHISASETVAKREVRAVIKGAEVVAEKFERATGRYTVVMEVPLYGISNSISSVALKKQEGEEIAQPTEDFDEWEIPQSADGSVGDGGYTGLIIDCRDLTETEKNALRPVLAPTIKGADDQNIYSMDDVSPARLMEQGMVSYADETQGSRARAGARPLVVKAAELVDGNTTPVLAPLDADRVLQENRASHFLNRGAVVLVGLNVMAESDDDFYV